MIWFFISKDVRQKSRKMGIFTYEKKIEQLTTLILIITCNATFWIDHFLVSIQTLLYSETNKNF